MRIRSLWPVVMAAALLTMEGAAHAAQAQRAGVVVTAGGITFTPSFAYSSATLTVRQRGARVVIDRRFTAQDQLRLELLADDGSRLADGRYVYELRLAGPGNNGEVITGRFEIRGGILVSTETIEVDVKQDIVDVPILGDAIVEGSICVSDSTDCLLDLIILESESFDTPGFGAADIKIKDNVPEIWFDDTTEEDADFALTAEDSTFFLRATDSDTLPVSIESGAPDNSLHVSDWGGVGMGTMSPHSTLEVAPMVGNAAFRLSFNGGSTWTVSNIGEIMTFNKIGTGGRELTFRERHNADGPTLQVQGDSLATNHVNTSSRALKTAFAEVDSAAILQGVLELPIQSWVYKEDAGAERHIGPTAEDFRAVFGLGDGETISTVDAQGIALAAVQALRKELESRDQQINALVAQNERLSERLAALEVLLISGPE